MRARVCVYVYVYVHVYVHVCVCVCVWLACPVSHTHTRVHTYTRTLSSSTCSLSFDSFSRACSTSFHASSASFWRCATDSSSSRVCCRHENMENGSGKKDGTVESKGKKGEQARCSSVTAPLNARSRIAHTQTPNTHTHTPEGPTGRVQRLTQAQH